MNQQSATKQDIDKPPGPAGATKWADDSCPAPSPEVCQTKLSVLSVSIVLPTYNEATNIRPIYDALVAVLDQEPCQNIELIFVDDGSTDNTAAVVQDLHHRDRRVKLIQLFRNFGHQIALTAGLQYARGDVVIVMDADLQHPPEIIAAMLAQYRRGYDVVNTARVGSQKGRLKNFASGIFYRIFRRLTKLDLQDNSADFRLMSRQVVDVLNRMPEKNRFLRGMTPWIGGRSTVVEYDLKPRLHGQPSYNLRRSYRLALTGLLSFTTLPLKWVFGLGLLFCLLSFGYGLYLIGHKLIVGTALPGYTDIIASILFLGGLQLVSLAIIGKFVSIVLEEVRDRPSYIIRKTLGLAPQRNPHHFTPNAGNRPSVPRPNLDVPSLLAQARQHRSMAHRRHNDSHQEQ